MIVFFFIMLFLYFIYFFNEIDGLGVVLCEIFIVNYFVDYLFIIYLVIVC